MSLENEFKYYLEHQDELVVKYSGKIIAIKGGEVLGAYDSEPEAIKALSKSHELGTYLLQRCLPGKDSYTRTFHSRVVYA